MTSRRAFFRAILALPFVPRCIQAFKPMGTFEATVWGTSSPGIAIRPALKYNRTYAQMPSLKPKSSESGTMPTNKYSAGRMHERHGCFCHPSECPHVGHHPQTCLPWTREEAAEHDRHLDDIAARGAIRILADAAGLDWERLRHHGFTPEST